MDDTMQGPALPPEHEVALLLGQVYESAPPSVQCSLLECLMRPLGVLALLQVGRGVFARIRLRSGRPDAPLPLQCVQEVRRDDVTALVDYVLQRGEDLRAGLCQLLRSSSLACTDAVTRLLRMLASPLPGEAAAV